ncbi:MAG: hypothetical protein IJE59_00495 [Clostridia bacterium]|nr:hypothetical protein [Clostridia bacterium]
MNTNDNIINKFKYIGLDLDNIPKFIKDFEPLEYRPSKFNDEHMYKVYRYINIKDIQILITPTNRLSGIAEKYGKAVPLYEYLIQNSEENIEKHTKFLSMISSMNIDKIEEIENEQKILNKNIPFKVKYPKDYLWQIYYSEYTDKYFMLVTTEDLDQTAFFYLLKKQLESKNRKKEEKIFVPISYTDHSREYLNKTQIADIENYLWFFTKEWPLVYEVYDKDNNLSLQITGKAFIYDDIQSDYKISLNNKEEAIKFYKLLKALFIMKTEVSNHYNITLSIDNKGSLEFNINNKKVIYEILSSIVKEEYLKAEDKKISLIDDKNKKEKELDKLQKKSNKLEKEYLEKEKQISTFLECKKTFFGKVKYFFKYKKVSLTKQKEEKQKEQDIKLIRINKYADVKSNYTLEELIELYKQIDKEEAKVKNLNLDIKALEQKTKTLESKVKNATQYIKEIDEHKKSIFEFWKFTNKDNSAELPAGEIKEENDETIKKVFDYGFDFEDLSIKLDDIQRNNLTKEELDSIYLTTTFVLEDINKISKGEKLTKEYLEELKKKAKEENSLLDKENFDIFGGMAYDNKLKILANKKHREVEREVFRILDINKNTTIDDYTDYLKQVIKNLESAFEKMKLPVDLPVYKVDSEKLSNNTFNAFNIEGKEAIYNFLENDKKKLNLYKINLKENTKVLAFTNIVYFENNNKTLPLGMNISENILLNNNLLELELKAKEEIKMVTYKNPKDQLSDIQIKTIKVEEYDSRDCP